MNTKRIWYSSKVNLASADTIHQILMFGSFYEIKSLKETIGEDLMKKLFLSYPKKIYTNSALNFTKNFILRIKDPINEQQYLKYAPRHIR